MANRSNGLVIRTLKQISRDKGVSPELRVRCCELLVLIDPNIMFNNVAAYDFPLSDQLAEIRRLMNLSPGSRKERETKGVMPKTESMETEIGGDPAVRSGGADA